MLCFEIRFPKDLSFTLTGHHREEKLNTKVHITKVYSTQGTVDLKISMGLFTRAREGFTKKLGFLKIPK